MRPRSLGRGCLRSPESFWRTDTPTISYADLWVASLSGTGQ
jgi:hypothetical protein